MSSIKCFDFSPQVHTVQALSGSNFVPMTEKASYILLPVSQWKPRAEQEPFAPKWFVLSLLALAWSTPVLASVKGYWRGLLVNLEPCTSSFCPTLHQLLLPFTEAYIAQPTLHQLLLPKLVNVTLGGIFVKEFWYTSGNHGSIWTNFCSPSKTTKLVQISIGLPERASKKCSYWKNQLSTWTWTKF